MTTPREVLHQVFGFDAFRPLQEQAITAHLAGRDVIVRLPTGGGKSLCYQVPAMVRAAQGPGVTLVVSPLIALMEDQVASLRAHGIEAYAMHSGQKADERRQVLDGAHDAVLLYVSPERVAVKRFRTWLGRHRLNGIAVDEAHCISEWGVDFRKSYAALDVLRREFPEVPILALSATATPPVMEHIASSLGLRDPLVLSGSFARPNLRFAVEHVQGHKARVDRVVEVLRELDLERIGGRAVVYAATRKRTKQVCDALRKQGFAAGYYHAGRSDSARQNAQDRFASGKHRVLVATTAFGMGVDQPDVRLVAHVQAPSTLEAYYQQAGRAGRDGEEARCLLLYSTADAVTRARLVGKASPAEEAGWKALQGLVYGGRCRQQVFAEYFTGEAGAACGACDVCTDASSVRESVDQLRETQQARRVAAREKRAEEDAIGLSEADIDQVLRFVDALKRPLGKRLVAQGLRGSKAQAVKRKKLQENPAYGALAHVPERSLLNGLEELLEDGRLARKGKKYPTVWLPEKRVRSATGSKPKSSGSAPKGLAVALKNYRRSQAKKRRWKPYQVFSNDTLQAIVAARPTSLVALLDVKGMGPKRVDKFGEGILELVARYP